MPSQYRFHNEMHSQPRGPGGCLLSLLGLVGLGVLIVYVLLPLLGIALAIVLGVALGVVVLALGAVAYVRLRAWWRRLRGRRGRPEIGHEAEVLHDEEDSDDDPPRPQKRLTVEVRRRPHRS